MSENQINPTLPLNLQKIVQHDKTQAFTLYWDFVVDGTASMYSIFPAVYIAASKFLHWIGKFDVRPMVGITIIRSLEAHEKIELVEMEHGSYYTDDTALFLKRLKNIKIYGGSGEGIESIAEGLKKSLEKYPTDSINRAVMVFTDAYEVGGAIDLSGIDVGSVTFFCTESLSEEGCFSFSFIDCNGNIDEEGSIAYLDILDLTKELDTEYLDNIVKPLKDLIKGVSIGV